MEQAHVVPRRIIIKKKLIARLGCFEMYVIFRKEEYWSSSLCL